MDNSLIKRQDAIDEVAAWLKDRMTDRKNGKPLTDRLKDLPSAQPLVLHCTDCEDWHTKQGVWGISVSELPSAQPERLTDDDFETIRIHLSAYKERLGNQHRWEEAEEYQRIIDRFMSFASAQPEPQWIPCNETVDIPDHEILACDKYGEEMFGYLAYEDEQWLCESDGCMMYDPIAWREKPEPYKERCEE